MGGKTKSNTIYAMNRSEDLTKEKEKGKKKKFCYRKHRSGYWTNTRLILKRALKERARII